MTSATPAPAAWGAMVTTVQVEKNTRLREYTMLNSQAQKRLAFRMSHLHRLFLCKSDAKVQQLGSSYWTGGVHNNFGASMLEGVR